MITECIHCHTRVIVDESEICPSCRKNALSRRNAPPSKAPRKQQLKNEPQIISSSLKHECPASQANDTKASAYERPRSSAPPSSVGGLGCCLIICVIVTLLWKCGMNPTVQNQAVGPSAKRMHSPTEEPMQDVDRPYRPKSVSPRQWSREMKRIRDVENAKGSEELHFHIGWPADRLEFAKKAGPLNLHYESDGTWHVMPVEARFRLPTSNGSQDVLIYQPLTGSNSGVGAKTTLGSATLHPRWLDTKGALLISVRPHAEVDERWFETNIGFALWEKSDAKMPASFGNLQRSSMLNVLNLRGALFSKVMKDTDGLVLFGEAEDLMIGGKQTAHHTCGLYVSRGLPLPLPHDLWTACDLYLIDLGSQALTITITTINPERSTRQDQQFTPSLLTDPTGLKTEDSPLAERAKAHHMALTEMIRAMKF